jgi:hypothetical protein
MEQLDLKNLNKQLEIMGKDRAAVFLIKELVDRW